MFRRTREVEAAKTPIYRWEKVMARADITQITLEQFEETPPCKVGQSGLAKIF